MSTRAFDLGQAANNFITVLPDLTTLPSPGDVLSAAAVASGVVTTRFNTPAGSTGGPYVATGTPTPRSAQDRAADVVHAKDFGAVFDGTSHPLSAYYSTLAAAQAVYPNAVALTDEIDGTAIQAAINFCQSKVTNYSFGGTVVLPPGSGMINQPLRISKQQVSLVSANGGQDFLVGSSDVQRQIPSGATWLTWTGVARSAPQAAIYMLTVAPFPGVPNTDPTTGRRLTGCDVIGIVFNCNHVTGVAGVLIASCVYGRVYCCTVEPAGISYASASVTSGSQNVTVSSTANIAIGQSVVSPSLANGAYVASIVDGTHFHASMQATATATETVTIGGEGIRFDCVDGLNDVNDCQSIRVRFWGYAITGAPYATAPLVMMGGSSVIGANLAAGVGPEYGNTSGMMFELLDTTFNNGHAVVMNNSDHNHHQYMWPFKIGTGPGQPLILNGSLDPNNGGARFHMIEVAGNGGGIHNGVGVYGFTQAPFNNFFRWIQQDPSATYGYDYPVFNGTGCTAFAGGTDAQTAIGWLGANQGHYIAAQLADRTTLGGNLRGTEAVDLQMVRTAATQVASGQQSFIGSGNGNAALAPQSVVCGGTTNISQGIGSFVGAGQNNNSNAGGAFIGAGNGNTASAGAAFVGGGQANTASAVFSAVVAGAANNATGVGSTVVGGQYNTASGPYSTALGSTALAGLYGEFAFSSGQIANARVCQNAKQILMAASAANTVPVRLTADMAAAGALNVVNLLFGGEALALRVQLIAADNSGANNYYAWTQPIGLLRRNGGTGAIVYTPGTPVTVTQGTTAGIAITEAADTTNGGYSLTFTPPTGNAQVWRVVATVEWTRVDSG